MLIYDMQAKDVDEVFAYLAELFGKNPRCELDYSSDIELLVSIVLSAQCTDKRVNMVTKELFTRCKTIEDYANINGEDLERIIYSTGFYRNKAKNIIALAKALKEQHNGKIPSDVESLAKLPGVGRKTASVFVAEYYKNPAIAVDTHVIRVSGRLGFTSSKNPEIIERDLMKLFNRENWARYHLYLVLFGRYNCTAKNPKCNDCKIRYQCKNTL